MKLLKSELEGKKEMCKTKMSKLESAQKRIIELQKELEECQNDAKICLDTKENIQRKLVNAQQDLAIAKMNISELEDHLKSRAELFDDLRDKMKTEIHAEFRFELENMKDVNSQLGQFS